ncbi:LuxR C-terminal-related transcriptional regulator [Paeniglutamicibacter gangotriensis]|uniref:LuxR C-terminal-related transcriptional regulator n=1 Tax=Paeniglutamicibacter gangotriensis TaxID=254787 RepID=UPI0037CBC76F
MGKAIWNRREYSIMLGVLRSDRKTGALLSGEFGTGKSMMVRRLLDSGDVEMPVIRLICSSALTGSQYGALAPLLAETAEEINDVVAIRVALSVVAHELTHAETQSQVLIIVEEAQSIDSASAFVLGQMVRSGRIKLLVLSNEEHQDPSSLEALMSVAQLTRIVLDPWTAEEIAEYCGSMVGSRVSSGAASLIHQATAGIQSLVQEFVELAVRRDLLVDVERTCVMRTSYLELDEHAVEHIRELGHRYSPQVLELLQMLSLAGPLTHPQLEALGLLKVLHRYPTALVRVQLDIVSISSDFFADGLRKSIPSGRRTSLYKKFSSVLGNAVGVGPEIAQWTLECGGTLSVDDLCQAASRALQNHDHALVLGLLSRTDTEQGTAVLPLRIQALIGLGQLHTAGTLLATIPTNQYADHTSLIENLRCVLTWQQPSPQSPIPDIHDDFQSVSYRQQGKSSVNDNVQKFDDCQVITRIRQARALYQSGKVSEALRFVEPATAECTFVAPACGYRLSLLVVAVRSLVASTRYDSAFELIGDFELSGSYEIFVCHGTLQVLRALVRVRQGQMKSAHEYLTDARPELSLIDPEGLGALCIALGLLTGTRDRGLEDIEDDTRVHRAIRTFNDEGFPRGPASDAWWNEDRVEANLLSELLEPKYSDAAVVQLIDQTAAYGLIVQGALNFHVWTHTRAESLSRRSSRFFSDLLVPEECTVIQRQILAIRAVQSGSVEQMEDYAFTVYQAGDPVLALEMMTRIVDYWTSNNSQRNRGFAIRKIHEWLYQMRQEPWGIVAQSLGESELTERENEIVELVRQGLSNREIARTLTVSQRTVEGHLYRIFAKLGISQRSELNFGEE